MRPRIMKLLKIIGVILVAIYNIPAERFMEHGKYRAEAMTIRDTKAEQGGVSEADWAKIDELLHKSWRSLLDVVNAPDK